MKTAKEKILCEFFYEFLSKSSPSIYGPFLSVPKVRGLPTSSRADSLRTENLRKFCTLYACETAARACSTAAGKSSACSACTLWVRGYTVDN